MREVGRSSSGIDAMSSMLTPAVLGALRVLRSPLLAARCEARCEPQTGSALCELESGAGCLREEVQQAVRCARAISSLPARQPLKHEPGCGRAKQRGR